MSANQRIEGAQLSVKFWNGRAEDFVFRGSFTDPDTLKNRATEVVVDDRESSSVLHRSTGFPMTEKIGGEFGDDDGSQESSDADTSCDEAMPRF